MRTYRGINNNIKPPVVRQTLQCKSESCAIISGAKDCTPSGTFKKAVASKSSSTAEFRRKIIRTLKHVRSINENPQHKDCPQGKENWCF
ncbi:hypothetical protein ElyMa_005606000 [Elysia marginata]|uniref:Uncharacterized protein n=1 Tax=Elysia marginata TaxID=1093978 RepID=A0AAV4F6B3_9GAST|nr:hypothetical protein ElyMa_005606000 [Elysia marginata]